MPTPDSSAQAPLPPFSPEAARSAREQLGMSPYQVVQGMAAFGVHTGAELVAAFEQGTRTPTEQELFALAGALWCDTADLTGRDRTLDRHRRAAGLRVEDAAAVLGVPPEDYARMEAAGLIEGDPRRALMLARELRLPVRDAVRLTGRDAELTGLLTLAVQGTWWKSQLKAVEALVPLPRPVLQQALRRLHTEYRSRTAGSTDWGAIFGDEDPPEDDDRDGDGGDDDLYENPAAGGRRRAARAAAPRAAAPRSGQGAEAARWLETIGERFWQIVDSSPPSGG